MLMSMGTVRKAGVMISTFARWMLATTLLVAGGCESHPSDAGDAVPASLVEHGVTTCTAPQTRSAEGPYSRRVGVIPPPTDPWIWHGGITIADLNGDGWLDTLTALEQGLELYEGAPDGSMTSRGLAVFGDFDLTYASGTSVADYDGDNDLDVYVMRVAGDPAPSGGEYGRNRLLENQGNGTFIEVTDAAGVDACGIHHRTGEYGCFKSMTSSWGDYDGDGDLDMYVGNYGFVDETDGTKQEDMTPAEPDFLYRNEGDGTFTNVSDLLPDILHDGYTYAGGLLDLDGDMDLDLYTVNDFGNRWPNQVLWNNGDGTFTHNAADESGLARSMTGMGLGVGDINGDGLPDLAIPEWRNDILFESLVVEGLDRPIWADSSDQRGFGSDWRATGRDVGWGSEMGDVDNDGDLDIVAPYGFVSNENSVWANSPDQPDAIYISSGGSDPFFTEQAAAWDFADAGMSRGVALADLNRDGWLDIGKRMLDDDNIAYVSRCGAESWVEIDLKQPGTLNTLAIGAKIELIAGGQRQIRWISAGGTGYASSPPPEAHFGLGASEVIEEVRVYWPDGRYSVLEDVEARQRLTITRG